MLCSACKEQDENKEAEKYCVDCQEYYCSECLKLHSTLPALKRHKLLDKEAGHDGQLVMVPTERCERHNFKTVDMFCQNHGVIGCATCIAVDHRSCQDVFYIPEFVKSRANIIPEFLQRMKNIESKFKEFLKRFSDEGNALKTNKQEQIEAIKSLAKKIEDKIKEAEQEAIYKVEERYNKLMAKINGDIDQVKKELETLVTYKDLIGSTIENNPQAFVSIKLHESKIEATEAASDDIAQIKLGRRVLFTVDSKYEDISNEKVYLGHVISTPYQFEHKGTFDIKISSDAKSCDVWGSCVLSDGSFVLADYANKNIKLVDGTSLTVVDHHGFSSEPTDVCCLDINEIGVCLRSEKKIKLFKVKDRLFPKSEINLNFNCWGMSHNENILYITDNIRIHLCDWEGTVLATLAQNSARNAMMSNLQNIFVSDCKKHIFVTDCRKSGKGVACFDNDGKILNFVSDVIKWAHGITNAGNGKAFACGFTSKNVILLSENGEFDSVIIKDGLSGPQALCFDLNRKRLIVPNHGQNVVQFFDAE